MKIRTKPSYWSEGQDSEALDDWIKRKQVKVNKKKTKIKKEAMLKKKNPQEMGT